jgi:hypothetical protein
MFLEAASSSATQEFPTFLCNRKVNYCCAQEHILSRAIPVNKPHSISARPILILPSCLCPGLPSPSSDSPYRTLYAFLFPPNALHPLAISFPLTCSFSLYFAKSTSYEALISSFFSPACYRFIPLWSEYFPHHLVLKLSLHPYIYIYKLRGLSLRADYTDIATAACRRS